MEDINEETKPAAIGTELNKVFQDSKNRFEEFIPKDRVNSSAIDPITSVLFDLEFRIAITRDNLNTAEQLLNQARELRKERKLEMEDFQQFESLLIATKDFFDVVPDDLITELFQSLKEEKEA